MYCRYKLLTRIILIPPKFKASAISIFCAVRVKFVIWVLFARVALRAASSSALTRTRRTRRRSPTASLCSEAAWATASCPRFSTARWTSSSATCGNTLLALPSATSSFEYFSSSIVYNIQLASLTDYRVYSNSRFLRIPYALILFIQTHHNARLMLDSQGRAAKALPGVVIDHSITNPV